MEGKSFIKYALIIIFILVAVFLSQQAYSQGIGKTLVSDAADKVNAYLAKGSDWVTSKIYPKISGQVQQRGSIIKNEVNQEKQKVSENIGDKIKNYFSGVANSILHPDKVNTANCPQVKTPAQN